MRHKFSLQGGLNDQLLRNPAAIRSGNQPAEYRQKLRLLTQYNGTSHRSGPAQRYGQFSTIPSPGVIPILATTEKFFDYVPKGTFHAVD